MENGKMIKLKNILTESKKQTNEEAKLYHPSKSQVKRIKKGMNILVDFGVGKMSYEVTGKDSKGLTLKDFKGETFTLPYDDYDSIHSIYESSTKMVQLVKENDDRVIKKIKSEIEKYLTDSIKEPKHVLFALLHITRGALIDANFHKEAKQLDNIFQDREFWADEKHKKNYVKLLQSKGDDIANIAKWDGWLILKGVSEFLKSKRLTKEPKELMKLVESKLNEDYSDTYFTTFTDAVHYARDFAEKKGFTVDEDDWFKQIGTGGRYTRSRPSKGKTHRFSIDLYKNGKKQRKNLQIQVYGMDSGNYELTTYIN